MKIEKITKIKPYTQHWNRLANNIARSYCPPIYACAKCGHPVVGGYCCTVAALVIRDRNRTNETVL